MTESALKLKITADMKQAMRDQAKERLGTIRLLLSAVKQHEIDQRVILDDIGIIAIIGKMIKQRRDSIAQFEQAGRTDLSEKEAAEIEVLASYMPAALTDEELVNILKEAIDTIKPESMKDMGKIMAYLKPKVEGRADMTHVSQKIKELLGV